MRSLRFGLALLSLSTALVFVSPLVSAADEATKATAASSASAAVTPPVTPPTGSTEPALDFFGDKPIADEALVHLPPR